MSNNDLPCPDCGEGHHPAADCQTGIKWSGDIGQEDLTGFARYRKRFWIHLDNKKEALVADVSITVFPFPRKGQNPIVSYEHHLSRPGIKSDYELKLYSDAIYRAGEWAGNILGHADRGN